MLKHFLPHKEVFSMWFESNYGEALLTPQHWHAAQQIMKFLELFYEATVTLSSVYYPIPPLIEDHVWFKERWMVASRCDECLATLCGLILG
jgi:hypothetical protein